MKKRMAAALLAATLALVACGGTKPVAAPKDNPAPPPATAPDNPKPPEPPQPPKPQPREIHGLYMTGYSTGIDKKFFDTVDYMEKSGLNAVVIDAKDDDGHTSWIMDDVPLVKEIGANEAKVQDIAARVKYLHDHHIYAIARIVCYADPNLGKKRPDLAIPNFIDLRGIRWPDPYNHAVWDYNLALAKNAVKQGFDEVQFDYIRFPEKWIDGFNHNVPVSKRTDAIEGFLKYAVSELKPLGVFVSADVFGLTTSVDQGDDMSIGQDYTHLAHILDYLYPMVYPSHFEAGTYGIADPNSQPGRIVYEALVRGQKRTMDVPVAVHRPWIQDFRLGKTYTAADVEDQIKGLAKAGIYQWVLWDPDNNYTRGVNYNIAPKSDAEPQWKTEYQAQLKAEAEAAAKKKAEEEAKKKAEEQSKQQGTSGATTPGGTNAGTTSTSATGT